MQRSVSIAVILAASAGVAHADLGQQGTIALEGDFDLDVRNHSSGTGYFRHDDTTLAVEVHAHYFIVDHVSLGLTVGAARISYQDPNTESTQVGGVGVGYHVRLGEHLHFWPQAFVGFTRHISHGRSYDYRRFDTQMALMLPLVIEPARHFYLAIGPAVVKELSSSTMLDEMEGDAQHHTTAGISTVLGGYFGD